jgi:hypothetical protein
MEDILKVNVLWGVDLSRFRGLFLPKSCDDMTQNECDMVTTIGGQTWNARTQTLDVSHYQSFRDDLASFLCVVLQSDGEKLTVSGYSPYGEERFRRDRAFGLTHTDIVRDHVPVAVVVSDAPPGSTLFGGFLINPTSSVMTFSDVIGRIGFPRPQG